MINTVLDHITITTPSLETGAKLVEDVLGVSPQKGGEHPKMGTHNLFLRLGYSVFLEIIAINPNAKQPDHPRWFALDDMKQEPLALLKTWVVGVDDIHLAVENSTESLGEIVPMSRGDTNWLFTIPKDGSLSMGGAAPAVIQWESKANEHLATKLIDHGLSLIKLKIFHPEAERLSKLLESINFKEEVDVEYSNEVKISAYIDTPNGIRVL